MKKVILASSSPRRKELLEKLGLKFQIDVSNYPEDNSLNLKPQKLAEFLSLQKAKEVAKRHKNAIVIGVDTLVVLDNEIIGKPVDKKDAFEMLKKLNGRSHIVISGLTLIDTKENKTKTLSVETIVYMKKMTDKEIKSYVQTKEPLDKAGGYGIQGLGRRFIEKIEGDYNNVVGLPISTLINSFKEFGINVPLKIKNQNAKIKTKT